MKITFSSLEKLNRWESFGFLNSVVDFADSHSEGMPELYISKYESYKAAFNAFDEALVQESKVASERLIAAEEGRDLAIRKIYGLVREYSEFPYDKEKEDAAKLLLKVFKPYGTGSAISVMPQDEETSVLINLLQDLQNKEANSNALVTLALTEVAASLELHNSVFVGEHHKRTKEDAHTILGIVKTTRTEAQNEFLLFVDIVNALALVEGEEKYANLKIEINKLHKNAVARAQQRTKKKDETPQPEVTE